MFGMCNYYIDRIEYKNLPESKYFDVVGWCIPKNLKPYSLNVLVKNKLAKLKQSSLSVLVFLKFLLCIFP